MAARLMTGDCRASMRAMAARGEQVHAVVCDPPYHLTSVSRGGSPRNNDPETPFGRTRLGGDRGFMGKTWDGGDIALRPETWRLAWDLLPPGGHLVAFGGTRTFHRMAVAIEDAGFEVRDTLMWLYGTGFPKSHDVSKGIDKTLGVKGGFGAPKSAAHAGWIERGRMRGDQNEEGWQRPWMEDPEAVSNAARRYLPGSPEAAAWEGWGTALKPAWEPIILARKPLVGTVAQNVLAHGTGAINVDGCRIAGAKGVPASVSDAGGLGRRTGGDMARKSEQNGRWPANVVHDGSDEVEAAFAAFGERGGGGKPRVTTNNEGRAEESQYRIKPTAGTVRDHGDSGSASRFFYSAKATKEDRAGSKHPTVKPVALMRWLVRMVTPPGGTVLDPFAGSGTTGAACAAEGFDCVLMEAEPEYQADIRRRLGLAEDPAALAAALL